jgi:hypothetical protein
MPPSFDLGLFALPWVGAPEQGSRHAGKFWCLLLCESQSDDCAPVGEILSGALLPQEGDLVASAVKLHREWLYTVLQRAVTANHRAAHREIEQVARPSLDACRAAGL